MRFLILNTDYPDFINTLYEEHPDLEHRSYHEQQRIRAASQFAVSDVYSHNLRQLGHEAIDIIGNNLYMQAAWARENNFPSAKKNSVAKAHIIHSLQRMCSSMKPMSTPGLRRVSQAALRSINETWLYQILEEQIRTYRPDILLNQSMDGISTGFLKRIKPYVRLLVGQHAATRLRDNVEIPCYDLVISSFPPTLEYVLSKRVPAELSRLGFDERILSFLKPQNQVFDLTFIGSFHQVHQSRTVLLERIAEQFPGMRVWGPNIGSLSSTSPLRKCYMGSAWGLGMYMLMQKSKITLNHHGDVPPFANNCRLYEATGVGTLLVTDWKENLHEIFEPGKEVVAYRTPEECMELIKYYLEHEAERKKIAEAGQKRALRDHTYRIRMQELVGIIHKYL